MENALRVIVLGGAPAIGKGTQCDLLRNVHTPSGGRYVPVSTGDLFRSGTGAVAESVKKTGKFVYDPQGITQMVVRELSRLEDAGAYDTQKDIVIGDGWPRDLGQYELMREVFDLRALILLDRVSDQGTLERALGRGREDDTIENHTRRLKTYKTVTFPGYGPFIARGDCYRVDARKPVPEVHTSILRIMQELYATARTMPSRPSEDLQTG